MNEPYDKQIEKLLADEDHLSRYRDSWFSGARKNPDESDRVFIENRIETLYAAVGKQRPLFVWCESPWQLVAAPTLIMTMASLDEMALLRLEKNLEQPLWHRCWRTISSQVAGRLDVFSAETLLSRRSDASRTVDPWNHVLFKASQQFREKLGISNYSTLRSILYQPEEEAQMVDRQESEEGERLADWLLGNQERVLRLSQLAPTQGQWLLHGFLSRRSNPDNQVKVHLVQISSLQRNERTSHLCEELFAQIPNDLLDCFRPVVETYGKGVVDYAPILFAGPASAAALELSWGVPRDPWLPVYCSVSDLLSESFYDVSTRECLDAWRSLLPFDFVQVFFDGLCLLCGNQKQMSCDAQRRLHSEDGPALSFPDGYEFYSWHGVTVDRWIIQQPELISVESIESEINAELRRVLLERFGEERYLVDSKTVMVQEDGCGQLYRKEFSGDEPLVMVRVENSTEESDGSRKHYFLRVPPNIQTACEAVAWTFGLNESDYHPDKES